MVGPTHTWWGSSPAWGRGPHARRWGWGSPRPSHPPAPVVTHVGALHLRRTCSRTDAAQFSDGCLLVYDVMGTQTQMMTCMHCKLQNARVHVPVHTQMHMHTHTHTTDMYTRVCARVCVCLCMCVVCICMHVCVSQCACEILWVCESVCVCVCVCMCMCACVCDCPCVCVCVKSTDLDWTSVRAWR